MKKKIAIVETVFDLFYLIFVLISALILLYFSRERAMIYFGILALVLGLGDTFHLIPRMKALWNGGFDKYTKSLGIGKAITSITMTCYYVLLEEILYLYTASEAIKNTSYLIMVLAIIRIGLCLSKKNNWTEKNTSYQWGIYRNIPFAVIGILVAGSFYWAKDFIPIELEYMYLAVVLSFGFYFPVVLWAKKYPKIGMLMLPKTCCYIWMVFMGINIFF